MNHLLPTALAVMATLLVSANSEVELGSLDSDDDCLEDGHFKDLVMNLTTRVHGLRQKVATQTKWLEEVEKVPVALRTRAAATPLEALRFWLDRTYADAQDLASGDFTVELAESHGLVLKAMEEALRRQILEMSVGLRRLRERAVQAKSTPALQTIGELSREMAHGLDHLGDDLSSSLSSVWKISYLLSLAIGFFAIILAIRCISCFKALWRKARK